MTTDAIFSEDRKHRFVLIRIWDYTKPKIMFIGLNPSTANENENDSTISKIQKIASYNGFGGCYMCNLFSYVSTDPTNKEICVDTEKNDLFLKEYASKSKAVLFAWGNFKISTERAKEVAKMFPDAYCIKKNKNGSPAHPLYQLNNSIISKF
jgi:hypothetical protein